MIKGILTAYLTVAGLVFTFSFLYFAIQIFRPDVTGKEFWRGDPEGPPPGKQKVLVIKTIILLFLAALTLLTAAIWPISPLITVWATLYDRIKQRREEGKNDDYRR